MQVITECIRVLGWTIFTFHTKRLAVGKFEMIKKILLHFTVNVTSSDRTITNLIASFDGVRSTIVTTASSPSVYMYFQVVLAEIATTPFCIRFRQLCASADNHDNLSERFFAGLSKILVSTTNSNFNV
jgi:hypothetical protein